LLCGCSCGHKIDGPSVLAGSTADSAAVQELKSIGNKVYFDYNSAALSNQSQATLTQQAAFMQRKSDLRFSIEGYCDERGTAEYNLALGERRANSAVKYLEKSGGFDPSRFTVTSYGKENPEALGHDESAWKQNRRVVTNITN